MELQLEALNFNMKSNGYDNQSGRIEASSWTSGVAETLA